MNRQYSFSPTVLERAGLKHECEANAGIFLPRRQTNVRKLRLGCQKSRKMFNVGNFREITGLTDHYFKKQKKDFGSSLLRKTASLTKYCWKEQLVSDFINENITRFCGLKILEAFVYIKTF